MERKISICLIVLLLFSVYTIFAQSKYGSVTMEEMEMTSYPQDTSAVALILLKQGNTFFKLNTTVPGSLFQFEHTIEMKIKILKKEGLDWCNQEIKFYEENHRWREIIRGLSGTTYNLENGKVVKTKLSKDFIFDGDINEKWKVKRFTMPAAKVGSVIEFKYTLTSDFFGDLRDFTFQSSIPILYTRYEIKIPEYFTYSIHRPGYVDVKDIKDEPINDRFHLSGDMIDFTSKHLVLAAENVPALKNEKYMWSRNDYISKISFELRSIQLPMQTIKTYSSSWNKVDEQLMKGSFGGNLKKTGLFKDDVSNMENTLENAFEILGMIKYKVKWNEENRLFPSNLGDALKKGIGNSADMNLLLVNALKAAGFDAYPVVLSTRAHGQLPIAQPSVNAFNYVITGLTIDSKDYFVDASAKYGTWNLLPEKCMITQGRKMKESGCSWIDLSRISSGITLIFMKSKFIDNQYKSDVTWTRSGNNAYDFRSFYFDQNKDQDSYISNLAAALHGEISDFKIENEMDISKDVKTEFTLISDMPIGDDHLYINPLQLTLFDENPFTAEERIFPVNFDHLEKYIQIVDLEIPEGYVVEELPKSERFIFSEEGPITFMYNIAQQGNTIKLQYQYQLKKLLFMQDEYPILKDFFAKVILKNSEQIVLKKKTETEVASVTE